MPNSFVQTQRVSALVLVWDEDGDLYRVPRPIIARYRLLGDERADIEAELLRRSEQGAGQAALSLGADIIRAIPKDTLAPYRMSGDDIEALMSPEEVQGNEQAASWPAGYGPTGIGDAWCIQPVSPWQIVEMDQQSSSPYAGLRDIA